jgi:hypothetical protein
LKILRGNQKSSIEVGQTIQCNRKIWRYQGIIKSRPIFLLHCIVCPSSMDDFWLLLGIFKPVYCIVLSVLLQWTTFDYPFVSSNLSFTLCCLSFFNGRLLIIPWYLQIFLLHCIVCPTSMDDFWLPLSIFIPFYYIVLSVLKKDRQYNVIERFEDTKG